MNMRVFRGWIIGGLFFVLGGCGISDKYGKSSVFHVSDFGAVGDSRHDDTAAVQEALDQAAGAGGGVVFIPAGNYCIAGHLQIPAGVTLQGVWTIPIEWIPNQGTVLLAEENHGSEEGSPFISLDENSAIKGVSIFYPKQDKINPVPYPWCISAVERWSESKDASGTTIRSQKNISNCSIENVMLVNPYKGVNFDCAGRHYIRNLYGQPLRLGIYVDQCYDVGRIENVHFWPFWSLSFPKTDPEAYQKSNIIKFVQEYGEAFVFARTDWQYCTNTFSWGYKIGYRFLDAGSGACNGNFLGIGADATNIAVKVEQAFPYGLLITNGEFVSFNGPNPTKVVVEEMNTGVVQFNNCSFWGPTDRIATIQGTGSVSFQQCNFRHWQESQAVPTQNQELIYAIDCKGGDLTVSACHFLRDAPDIKLGPEVQSAVICGNTFLGEMEIANESKGNVQIGLNTNRVRPAVK